MRLFFAAVHMDKYTPTLYGQTELTEGELAQRNRLTNVLESYHYVGKQSKADALRESGFKIFLDSGAFSAYFADIKIDINEYCDYIHRNQDFIEVASVLDGIGDPLKTWENQQEMERQGVSPLPCFHYGEDPQYLEWYVERYEFITLGGMVPIETGQLEIWLDEIWGKYLTNEDGSAKINVHGFGMTSVPLMYKYPWYSVDSTAWRAFARFGNVVMERGRESLGILEISNQKMGLKERGKHFYNLPSMQQKTIRAFAEKQGIDMERMSEKLDSRYMFNMATYLDVEANLAKADRRFKPQPTLF